MYQRRLASRANAIKVAVRCGFSGQRGSVWGDARAVDARCAESRPNPLGTNDANETNANDMNQPFGRLSVRMVMMLDPVDSTAPCWLDSSSFVTLVSYRYVRDAAHKNHDRCRGLRYP